MSLSWIQASEEVLTQEGKLLALVIIMLSALEEQVSGFFFGVFNYVKKKKKDQKELLQLNSSRYCSLRITKANAITRRMWEKRKGHFWSLGYLLEGDWTLCGSGSLAFYLCSSHVQGHDRPSFCPPAPGLGKVGALLVGRPAELTLHT